MKRLAEVTTEEPAMTGARATSRGGEHRVGPPRSLSCLGLPARGSVCLAGLARAAHTLLGCFLPQRLP